MLGGEGGGSQSRGVREETMKLWSFGGDPKVLGDGMRKEEIPKLWGEETMELWGWEWGTLKLWGMGDPRAMGVGNGVRRDLKCWGDGMG